MSQRSRSEPELKALRERIGQWRANRQSREMPSELWDAAAEAARRLGVSYVSTALGVGYASLKARASGAPPRAATPRPAFVEVSGAQLLTPSTSGAVTIELERGDARMIITVPVSSGMDFAALVSAFACA
jgi:hypothetical protein